MFRNFYEIEQLLLAKGIKRKIALCGAHDESALRALVKARQKGLAEGMLIGDESAIIGLLSSLGETVLDYEIVNETRDNKAARIALDFVHSGAADIPMKGLVQSISFILAVINPTFELMPKDAAPCAVTVFYYPPVDRLMFVTDCAINVSPSLEDKARMIRNTVPLVRAFGQNTVNIAVVSVLETVNPEIVSSVDADALAKMEWPEGIVVEGPFGLDNALDEVAAKHKGIISSVAGKADLLIMPDLCAGNIFHKTMHFFGNVPTAGVMCGPTSPVVFNSRTDSPETKYNSILTAIMQSCN